MKISVILEALTGSFETDIKRASKASEKAFRQMQADAKRAGIAIGTALVAGAAAAGVAIKSAIDEMDEIGKTAQKIGVGTEALSALQYAAQMSDVSINQLQTGLTRLVRAQADAARGSEKQVAIFRALGVAFEDASGNLRSADAVFRDVAQAFAGMEDGAGKTALAVDLFGKSGAQLIPLLNEGADGIQEFTDKAREMGLVVSQEAAAAADEFNDNLQNMGAAVKGITMQVAEEMLPAMRDMSAQVVAMANDPAFVSGLASAIEGIGRAVIFAANAMAAGVNAVRDFAQWLAKLTGGEAMDSLATVNERLATVNAQINALQFGKLSEENKERLQSLYKEAEMLRRLQSLYQDLESKSPITASGASPVARRAAPVIRGPVASTAKEALKEAEQTAARIEEMDREMFAVFDEENKQAAQAYGEFLVQLRENTTETTTEMSEFAKQAAANIQDAFANFLFDPFDDGLQGMAKGFVDTLRRMAAEAVAAKIFEKIAAWGTANTGAGGATGFFASIASMFAGTKDAGGSIRAGQFALVGERRPELVAGPATVVGGAQTAAILQASRGSTNVRIVNAIDPRFIADYLASPAGDEVYLNLVSRNARKTRALVA